MLKRKTKQKMFYWAFRKLKLKESLLSGVFQSHCLCVPGWEGSGVKGVSAKGVCGLRWGGEYRVKVWCQGTFLMGVIGDLPQWQWQDIHESTRSLVPRGPKSHLRICWGFFARFWVKWTREKMLPCSYFRTFCVMCIAFCSSHHPTCVIESKSFHLKISTATAVVFLVDTLTAALFSFDFWASQSWKL